MDTNTTEGRSHSEDSPSWQPRRAMLILGCAGVAALLVFIVGDGLRSGFKLGEVAATVTVGALPEN